MTCRSLSAPAVSAPGAVWCRFRVFGLPTYLFISDSGSLASHCSPENTSSFCGARTELISWSYRLTSAVLRMTSSIHVACIADIFLSIQTRVQYMLVHPRPAFFCSSLSLFPNFLTYLFLSLILRQQNNPLTP